MNFNLPKSEKKGVLPKPYVKNFFKIIINTRYDLTQSRYDFEI